MAFLLVAYILDPTSSYEPVRFVEGSSGQQPMPMLSVAAWSTGQPAVRRWEQRRRPWSASSSLARVRNP